MCFSCPVVLQNMKKHSLPKMTNLWTNSGRQFSEMDAIWYNMIQKVLCLLKYYDNMIIYVSLVVCRDLEPLLIPFTCSLVKDENLYTHAHICEHQTFLMASFDVSLSDKSIFRALRIFFQDIPMGCMHGCLVTSFSRLTKWVKYPKLSF